MVEDRIVDGLENLSIELRQLQGHLRPMVMRM